MNELQRLVDLIDARLAPLEAERKAHPTHAEMMAHIKLCESVARGLIDEMVRRERASYRDGGDYRLRLAGFTSSCTGGPLQLLRNWQNAARRRLSA